MADCSHPNRWRQAIPVPGGATATVGGEGPFPLAFLVVCVRCGAIVFANCDKRKVP